MRRPFRIVLMLAAAVVLLSVLVSVAQDYLWLRITGGAYQTQMLDAGDAVPVEGTDLVVRLPMDWNGVSDWFVQLPTWSGLDGPKFSWRQTLTITSSDESTSSGAGFSVIAYNDDKRWADRRDSIASHAMALTPSAVSGSLKLPAATNVFYTVSSSDPKPFSTLLLFFEGSPGYYVEARFRSMAMKSYLLMPLRREWHACFRQSLNLDHVYLQGTNYL